MGFISNETAEEESDYKLVFSDDSGDEEFFEETKSDQEFIDDFIAEEEENGQSFYRKLDNRNDYIKISNQTSNPTEVVDEEESDFLGEDDLPELYDLEDREQVDFDLSDSTADKSAQFRKGLLCSFNVDNHFFYSVVYGLMYLKLKGREHFIEIKNARGTSGDELFFKLKEIENFCILDHSVFGFFDRCQKMNEVLSEYGYILRFYKRRNKFRYQIRKKLKEKNEIRKELPSCIIKNLMDTNC